MPKHAANPEPVQAIKTLTGLIAYLRDELGWPIAAGAVGDDLTFDWSAEELRLADGHAARLQGGTVRQLRPLVPNQPWGIFLVEFADTQVYRTSLRQILRGLVPARRRDASLQSWQHENLLFLCATADYQRFTFAHFKGDQAQRAKLATFGWRRGSAYVRTLLEHNLPHLAWPKDDGADPAAWQSQWAKAFDKEPVTRKFFDDFNDTFRKVCHDIANRHSRWSRETVEREAQTLLNRLLFLYFIQRKGWLNRDRQYLADHFREHYRRDPASTSFLKDFLRPVFVKLSTKGPQADIPGHDLPFLNGGLFADEYGAEQRDDDVRRHHELKVGNDTFQHVFDDLLEAYNFTVREDTPLDVDVAIDPEMLGKIFESLVLQLEQSQVGGKSSRHDTGSYYTPRPIVHYLCRDALAAWLADQPPFTVGQASPPASSGGVPAAGSSPPSALPAGLPLPKGEGRGEGEGIARPSSASEQVANRSARVSDLLALDASQGLDEAARASLNALLTPEQARALAEALQELRACDLAVGSGAFPVALLHELVNVARLAETRARGKDPAATDPRWLFDTKTRFIERVLYGVDIQARAIEICKLRLWLSLVVDYPLDVDVDTCEKQSFRDNLKRLPALPNLDFKIRRANSLIDTIHGEPVPLGQLHAGEKARLPLNRLITSKREFYRADSVPQKRKLRFAIYEATAELAQIELTAARNELGLLPDPANAAKVAELDHGQKEMAKVLAQIRDARKLKAAAQDDALERLRAFFDNEDKPTFVWQLDFAEVFHRAVPLSHPVGEGSGVRAAADLALNPQPSTLNRLGGFDLIVGNPPYVRHELLGREYKETQLAPLFPEVYAGTADLYVYFYGRAHQLLCQGGVGAFISSNKWLRAAYGEPLRRHLLDDQSVRVVVDFGDLPIFESAVTYPCIVVWQKRRRGTAGTCWAVISNLETCYAEGVSNHVSRLATPLPATQFGPGKPRLCAPATMDRRQRMEKSSGRLGDLPNVQFYRGVVTGLNEAFYLTPEEAKERFQDDDQSAALLRPAIRGEDVRRFEIHPTGLRLLRVPCGTTYSLLGRPNESAKAGAHGRRAETSEKRAWAAFRDAYPAAAEYLAEFETAARTRDDQGDFWWELRPCDYYHIFEKPKVVFPQTGKEPRFAMDLTAYDLDQTVYAVAAEDWFVLALLNSAPVEWFIREVSSTVRGGYLRFLTQYLERIPVPSVSAGDRKAVAALARKAQNLHTQRRAQVEKFLSSIGVPPAKCTSRSPLDQPWALKPDEFTRCAPRPDVKKLTAARDETAALTAQIERAEREIDTFVASLYGV